MINSTKNVLDTVNSISWLLMDACWMMQYFEISLILVIPTLLSAILLIFLEKDRTGVLISVAVASWCLMNSIWLIVETKNLPEMLIYAKLSFGVGIFCLLIGMMSSAKPLFVLSRFRRSSIKNFKSEGS